MSLLGKRRMTAKRLAAIRQAQQASHGPTSDKGRQRIRRANLRHGFYSKDDEAALRALHEKPTEFLELLQGFRGKWLATDVVRDRLVYSLARAWARVERTDRQVQGLAVRQTQEADRERDTRAHARMMHLRLNEDYLRLLAQWVSDPCYVATPDHLNKVKKLRDEGVMNELGDVVVALFFELRDPNTPGLGEPGECENVQKQQRLVLERIKDIFGLSGKEPYRPGVPREHREATPDQPAAPGEPAAPPAPAPPNPHYPHITAEDFERREPARQLLENLLRREAENYDARRNTLLKEFLAGPTPFQRAVETSLTESHAKSLLRVEEANFRQVSRLMDMLMKLERHEAERKILEASDLE